MKKIALFVLTLFTCGQMNADGVKTAGNGNTYSFEKLSQTAGSSVTKEGDIYIVTGCDTISAGDHFKIDEGVEVRFGDDGELLLQGTADLQATSARTHLTRLGESETCFGIMVQNEESVTPVSGLDFEYVGLRNYSGKGMEVSDCTFKKHNGTQSAALFLGTDGAEFMISECRFDSCMKAAIGGAANFMCPVAIDHCHFYHNSQANGNIPQLNLTASTDVNIVDCTLEGDSTKYMSGGIAVANWYGVEGLTTTIANCKVSDSRYGLTTMGIMDVYITDNQLINNRFEQNPMNGGSAISLYDPYYKQKVYISGNRLEKSLWGITVIGCGDVNIGKTEVGEDAEDYNPGGNVFVDNGFDGNLYDLYNNSVNTVWAQGNTWNVATQDSTSIEGVIFHKNDDASLGEVIFMPAAAESGSNTPNYKIAISVSNNGVRPGDRCGLIVDLQNGDTIINGYQFNIELPDGFTLAEKDGDYIYELSDRYSKKRNMQVSIIKESPNVYKVICFSLTSETIIGPGGPVITLTLSASDNIEDNNIGRLTDIVLSTENGQGLTLADVEFNISKIKYALGDANGDSSVNVADVMLIVNHILGNTLPVFHEECANMNGDSRIDVADVMLVVNMILSGEAQASAVVQFETSGLEAVSTSVNKVELRMNNMNEYTAFQMQVKMPAEAHLLRVEMAEGTTDHRVLTKEIGEGLYNVIVYSLNGENFKETFDGTLLRLVTDGRAKLQIRNIQFTNPSFETITFSDVTGTTGIEDVASDATEGVYYNLQGMPVKNLSHGVFIKNGEKIIMK